jgi:hypothetical protein
MWMGMMWMGMMGMGMRTGMGMGMGMGNGNGMGYGNLNGKWNELFTIILYFLCPKSYTYPVSATATYTSPSNYPKSFTSQNSWQPKCYFLIFFTMTVHHIIDYAKK